MKATMNVSFSGDEDLKPKEPRMLGRVFLSAALGSFIWISIYGFEIYLLPLLQSLTKVSQIYSIDNFFLCLCAEILFIRRYAGLETTTQKFTTEIESYFGWTRRLRPRGWWWRLQKDDWVHYSMRSQHVCVSYKLGADRSPQRRSLLKRKCANRKNLGRRGVACAIHHEREVRKE